jgi:hypothetical protein
MSKHALRICEEIARDAEVFGVFVGDAFDAASREGVNVGATRTRQSETAAVRGSMSEGCTLGQ